MYYITDESKLLMLLKRRNEITRAEYEGARREAVSHQMYVNEIYLSMNIRFP